MYRCSSHLSLHDCLLIGTSYVFSCNPSVSTLLIRVVSIMSLLRFVFDSCIGGWTTRSHLLHQILSSSQNSLLSVAIFHTFTQIRHTLRLGAIPLNTCFCPWLQVIIDLRSSIVRPVPLDIWRYVSNVDLLCLP